MLLKKQSKTRDLYNMQGRVSQKNRFCWMRQIEVRLTSNITKRRIVFGGTDKNQLSISIKGNKYLSALKDNDLVTAGKISYSHGECAFIANEISKLLTESGITIQDNVAFLVERFVDCFVETKAYWFAL